MLRKRLLIGVYTFVGLVTACGSSSPTSPGSSPTSPGSSPTTQTPTPTETWTVEPGIRLSDTTSTSTVRRSDGTYRTYYGGVRTASSVDG